MRTLEPGRLARVVWQEGRRQWPVAALVALIVSAAWELALAGRIIARGDLLLYFYPLREFAAQALREGRLPLWNPYVFMGAPFLANIQTGVLYPPNVALTWLPAERAVSLSIVWHLVVAGLGAYALGLRLRLGRAASFGLGTAFGLGGYLGAQVEHLNQLQTLAWLPWAITGLCAAAQGEPLLRSAWLLALVLTLQLLAGHTQSLYIALVGMALSALVLGGWSREAGNPLGARAQARAWLAPALALVIAVALAVLLGAAQLLPTWELSRESARVGGLPFNEAGSFSWRPWVVGRALLPTYGDPLFPEYVAYLGAVGLALAVLGGLAGPRQGGRAWWLGGLLIGVGVVLALGVATPLFPLLYRWLPGFGFFRAQARWLALFALGAATWVGVGVAQLARRQPAIPLRRWLMAWALVLAGVGAAVWLGARLSPEAAYASLPPGRVLLGWGGGALLATLTVAFALGVRRRWAVMLPLAALVGELWVAAQFQPFSRTTDPQALTSLRPSTAFLLHAPRQGRVLALSSLGFDPGDKPEQELIYLQQLDPDEVYDRLIATKHKEILSPNLSSYYRIPSVDGYDGGLLPTRRYAAFVRQFAALPAGTVDGRLREFLSGLPEARWLEAMAVRYVIADKTQDIFVDDVYYDLLVAQPLTRPIDLPLQPYESTALGLVWSAGEELPAEAELGHAIIRFAAHEPLTLTVRARRLAALPYHHARLSWDEPRVPLTLTLRLGRRAPDLRAITSIDARDRSFLAQPLLGAHALRVVHSGDVKVYEHMRPAPRATLNGEPAHVVDEAETWVRVALPQDHNGGELLLRDACYPDWQAVTATGSPLDVRCAEGMFRAAFVPPGVSEVRFVYQPLSVRVGVVLSGLGAALWLVLGWLSRRRRT